VTGTATIRRPISVRTLGLLFIVLVFVSLLTAFCRQAPVHAPPTVHVFGSLTPGESRIRVTVDGTESDCDWSLDGETLILVGDGLERERETIRDWLGLEAHAPVAIYIATPGPTGAASREEPPTFRTFTRIDVARPIAFELGDDGGPR
jgi:hypothetical protein